MRKSIFILLLTSLVLLVGCLPQAPLPALSYEISGCDLTPLTRSPSTKLPEEPEISIKGNLLFVKHPLNYVCCANITIEWAQKDNLIEITETNIGEMCRCLCDYDIRASLGPLKKGTYLIKLSGVKYQDTKPDLLIEEEVEVLP